MTHFDSGGRLTLFSYTVESLAPLYRAVMRLFFEAKARYRIQFRPDEVAAELHRSFRGEIPEGGIDRALDQLVEWGNLRRAHDAGRVATLEDFRRRHFIYQLTAAGEAAERAVGEVLEALEKSGSLQRVMLGTILRNLTGIRQELEAEEPAPERLFEHLFNVTEQFRALTENASTFLARLHEAIDQGEVHAEAFILYKQAVLEYLEQFLGELAETAPQITREIQGIEAAGSDRLIALAARADAAPAPLGVQDPTEGLRRKWNGIAAWFVGDGREPATVERLRAAARGAINRILLVLERLHEKRFRRVSRTADLLRLAVGFDRLDGEAGGEERAHRLFQAVFCLFGARHLGGLDEDPDLVRPGVSWWEAPPVPVAPALRDTGRTTSLGRAAQIVDHSRVKRLLVERHRRLREAQSAALARFAGHGPLALADLPPLSPDEFSLLLSLLDRLLSASPGPGGLRRARSLDGRLRLRLEEPEPGALTVVETATGRLTLPAYVLTVEDVQAPTLAQGGAR
ncbi:MAG TPA: TIGR02677 family protein [Thermoanaerobaculia bacterium]|nr:TIGR02677 family protein [Thermoanaerobaculia bacterium]